MLFDSCRLTGVWMEVADKEVELEQVDKEAELGQVEREDSC